MAYEDYIDQRIIKFEIKTSPEYIREELHKKIESQLKARELKEQRIREGIQKMKRWCKKHPDKVNKRLQIARSKKKYIGTKIEKIVMNYLIKRNVEFIPQCFGIIGTPDFIIPNHSTGRPVAIFVDGCFWHGCRACIDWTKVKFELFEYMVEHKHRDTEITKKLQKMGFKVIRLWEHDIISGKYKHILNKVLKNDPL